jgi:hypothetical protein
VHQLDGGDTAIYQAQYELSFVKKALRAILRSLAALDVSPLASLLVSLKVSAGKHVGVECPDLQGQLQVRIMIWLAALSRYRTSIWRGRFVNRAGTIVIPGLLLLGATASIVQACPDTTDNGQHSMSACAETNLGWKYEHGDGVPQDYAQAMNWYRKAAAHGGDDAQDNLGYMYAHGIGVPQDYAQALMWYQKAAANNNDQAQNNLGTLYEYGRGVPQDFALALSWYRRAAAQGNIDSQVNLGNMYAHGRGTPRNYAHAMAWYRKAADQGDAEAQSNLGTMYTYGYGMSADYAQAQIWLRKAAEQGYPVAPKYLWLMAALIQINSTPKTFVLPPQYCPSGEDSIFVVLLECVTGLRATL